VNKMWWIHLFYYLVFYIKTDAKPWK
jgi:hypothetical protein